MTATPVLAHPTDESTRRWRLPEGLSFADLYCREGLIRVDEAFVDALQAEDPALYEGLMRARRDPDALADGAEADLLVALGPAVDRFVGALFGVESELRALRARHDRLATLFEVKRRFVQRRAAKRIKPAEAASLDDAALRAALHGHGAPPDDEVAFADAVAAWLDAGEGAEHEEAIESAMRYAAWAVHTDEGQRRHADGVLFKLPRPRVPDALVPVETEVIDGVRMLRLPDHHLRRREGFDLTDPGFDLTGALDASHYCILCHNQGRDSCSKGLRDKKTGAFRRSASGVPLTGCPLEERISEMHTLKRDGWVVGALAVVVVDNPMCAATGHRICNDCMKACVFQKQDPVDIPQAETRALKDVLGLPCGFEIYSLLTRWNPLNLRRPLPRPPTGRKILVVGLGPAGFTLAHHLLNDGHDVFAVDGLKIEPLPEAISGVTPRGARVPFAPVASTGALFEALSERVLAGFGGVAEYGITVRWDKNFLKVIRLLLERRGRFAMYGGVRFGGALDPASAFAMGFDHVALCAGAGRPRLVAMPNGLAPGVRQASDFLMALQLTGAAKADSVANLQLRLPAVVVGGGLTGVDTATEALAYYPVQVEKFLERCEALEADGEAAALAASWTAAEREVADEMLDHARALRAERAAAAAEDRAPRIFELLEGWGGVTLAYRRRLIDAPSYRLNHEEVELAMQEGIRFAEHLSPARVEVDDHGHAAALVCHRTALDPDGKLITTDEEVTLPAQTILVAAGTRPNTVLAREEPELLALDGGWFQAVDPDGRPVSPERLAKPVEAQVLLRVDERGRSMSFFGDLHPSFAGNVVKAMASAKQGYPSITRVVAGAAPHPTTGEALREQLDRDLRPVVHEVIRLTPNIVEIVLEAPAAARAFRPGQFFRLQNYERFAARHEGTALAMEGLALTGAWVDVERGLLSTIVLEMGGSSKLCALLQPGEPVVLMGPTGTPTEIPDDETVLLVGGGLGNAVLFSIGQALRAAGSRVLYFAGYKALGDRYHVPAIEAASDQIVWCCDEAPGFAATRPGDATFVGNIVEALIAYGEGRLGGGIPLPDVDRILTIGSDRMMHAVAQARHDRLAPYLRDTHLAIGSINSPMQCMMKEICAQCLQVHKDPETGEERVVFSCFNQDQCLDHVDFGSLRARLGQNGAQEKLSDRWIDRSLRRLAGATGT